MLTLEQFAATRKRLPNVAVVMSADPGFWDGMPPACFVYADGVYIEDYLGRESENSGFRFYLILYRDEYQSNDLGELEPRLYEFWKTECPTKESSVCGPSPTVQV